MIYHLMTHDDVLKYVTSHMTCFTAILHVYPDAIRSAFAFATGLETESLRVPDWQQLYTAAFPKQSKFVSECDAPK